MADTTHRKTLLGRSWQPSERVEALAGERTRAPDGSFGRRVQAVMFTDIVGSTAYFERHGDQAGMAMVERHNRLLIPSVQGHGGRVIKTIGDAIMAAFPEAGSALAAAVEMQRVLKQHNSSQPSGERILVRIGINHGEVIVHNDDLFGDVVNAAARVEALAGAGQILLSRAARDALGEKAPVPCLPFDAVTVKGKSNPIEVFEARWDPDAQPDQEVARPVASAGDVLGGRFEILALLGEGGMGQVFRARDRALDEEVALKFIRRQLAADPESLRQFKQEVKLARSITHPNICRIHEFLQMDGRTFLSMELVDGEPLDDLLQRSGPLPLEQARHIMAGICSGLEAAHARGVTHRDLKPGNILLEHGSGRVVITDFGIARLADPGRREIEAEVAGTPEYMSPEQAQGRPAGPAADVYSAGVILYEMLTGRLPITGDTPVEVARRQVEQRPMPPRQYLPSIPAELERVLLRCLAKDPRRRFQRARQLAAALGLEVPRAAVPRGWLLALGVGAVVALALLLLVLLQPFTPRPPGGERRLTPLLLGPELDLCPRWSPAGKSFAFLRDGDLWLSGAEAPVPRRLTSTGGAARSLEAAGLAWLPDASAILLATSGEEGQALLAVPSSGPASPSRRRAFPGGPFDVSPDGRQVVAVRARPGRGNDLLVADLAGGEPRLLREGTPELSYERPRWSPDGERIAVVVHHQGFATTRDIAVVEIASGKMMKLTGDGLRSRADNTDPAWSPDGEWIVYSSRRSGMRSLWCVPAAGGKSYPLSQGTTRHQRLPDVSSDGSSIIFETVALSLDVRLLDDDGNNRALSNDPWPDRFPTCAPDGSRIAYRSSRGTGPRKKLLLMLYEPENQAEEIFALPTGVRDLAWCGNQRLLFARTSGQERSLWLLELSDFSSRPLVRHFHRLWSPATDRACRRVVFAGRRTREESRRLWLLDLASGRLRALTADGELAIYPALSPDGRQVAFRWAPSLKQMASAELRLLPSDGGPGRKLLASESFSRSRRRLRWSPDGRFVYFMEAQAGGGRLWRVSLRSGRTRALEVLPDIHTFDFDICPGGDVVYPSVRREADVYSLSGLEW